MENSKIQWTHHTYNPWLGCRKVCGECDKCYIVHQTPLRVRNIKHGSTRHRCAESTLRAPFAWDKKAKAAGERRRVFCLSLGDWLDNEVPIEWLAELLAVVYRTPNLDWILLTKRPQNWETRIRQVIASNHAPSDVTARLCLWLGGVPPKNVWFGVSAGVKPEPALSVPAKIHFLSCEPMLRALDETVAARFDWIIFGGESDPDGEARSFDLIDLDRGLTFCRRNKIPAFVKQLGAHPTFCRDSYDHGLLVNYGWAAHVKFPRGCEIKLRDSKHGGDASEWPEHLRIREFPIAAP